MATTHARPIRRGPWNWGFAGAVATAALACSTVFSPDPHPLPHRRSPPTAGRSSRSTASTRYARSSATRASVAMQPLVPLRRRHLVPHGTPVYATINGVAYISPRPSRDGVGDRRRRQRRVRYWHVVPSCPRVSASPRTARSSARSPAPGSTCTSPSTAMASTSTRSARARWGPTPTGPSPPSRAHRRVCRRYLARRGGACRRRTGTGPRRPCRRSLRCDADPHLGPLARQAVGPGPPSVEAHGRRPGDHQLAHRGRLPAHDPSNTLWSQTYTSWTRQNKKIWDARYGFYLVHGFDTRTLHDGTYLVEVKATDIRGNSGTRSFSLTVANAL